MTAKTLQQQIYDHLLTKTRSRTAVEIASELNISTSKTHPTVHALVKKGALVEGGKVRHRGYSQRVFYANKDFCFDSYIKPANTYAAALQRHEIKEGELVDKIKQNGGGAFGLMAAQLL